MGQTQKLLELLDRVERAGGIVNRAALTRKFNFTLSGIVTPGVDIKVFTQLCEFVTSIAEESGFICELSGIVMFPIITDPAVYSRADFTTHKRKDSAYFVGRNINIDVWKRARKARRIVLASETLKSAVLAIPDKHLLSEHKMRLLTMIGLASHMVVKK